MAEENTYIFCGSSAFNSPKSVSFLFCVDPQVFSNKNGVIYCNGGLPVNQQTYTVQYDGNGSEGAKVLCAPKGSGDSQKFEIVMDKVQCVLLHKKIVQWNSLDLHLKGQIKTKTNELIVSQNWPLKIAPWSSR